MNTVAPCVVSLIACLLCSSPCLRVDKHMIQIDVPPPTLGPPERDLSVPPPPDVRSSICLAHPWLPKGTTLPPDVDKMVGSSFCVHHRRTMITHYKKAE
jgi:hypothetical protein